MTWPLLRNPPLLWYNASFQLRRLPASRHISTIFNKGSSSLFAIKILPDGYSRTLGPDSLAEQYQSAY
jgi:hypothetical protein